MSQPITIRRYLTPLEGEMARLFLAQEDIRAFLENAELLTWNWHFSNAFRGVNVLVSSVDFERVQEILRPHDELATSAAESAHCDECGELFLNGWAVCWRCGCDVRGDRDETFFIDTMYRYRIVEFAANIKGLGLLVIAIAAVIILIPPLAFALAFLLLPIVSYEALPPQNTIVEPEDFASLPDEPSIASVGNELCRRALASAMFGIGWFPPFTLHSYWLLYLSRSMPVDLKGRFWRIASWTLNNFFLFATVLILLASAMRRD